MAPDTAAIPTQHAFHLKRLALAITINGLAWVLLGVWESLHSYAAGVIMTDLGALIAIAITSACVLVVHLCAARRAFRIWHIAPYAAPTLALMAAGFVHQPPPKPGQVQNLVSPSGRYTVRVPIENDRWVAIIRDTSGCIEYRDPDSRCPGWFSAYWIWDDADRLWMENSDDGQLYWWEKTGGAWRKHTHDRNNPADPHPPAIKNW